MRRPRLGISLLGILERWFLLYLGNSKRIHTSCTNSGGRRDGGESGNAARRCACAWLGTGGVGRLLKLLSDNEPSLGVPGTWVLALGPPRAIFVQSLLREGNRQTDRGGRNRERIRELDWESKDWDAMSLQRWATQCNGRVRFRKKDKGKKREGNWFVCGWRPLSPHLITLSSLTFRQLTYLISDIEHLI